MALKKPQYNKKPNEVKISTEIIPIDMKKKNANLEIFEKRPPWVDKNITLIFIDRISYLSVV